MRAVVYTKYGPPDVLSVQEVPTPRPKADEVLVRVHAATMNRTDTGFRSAEYFVSRFFTGLFKPRRQITGSEFAGEVVEVGKDVSEFKIGDRVFGFNDSRFGGHAEYKAEPENGPMAKIPEGLSYQQAARGGRRRNLRPQRHPRGWASQGPEGTYLRSYRGHWHGCAPDLETFWCKRYGCM
jgi:NADPH:quinone reductase-like Zn-dependent oxidoreductase